MEERLKEAKTYYEAYKKYYPEGERMEEMNASLEDINSRLQNF